MINAFIIFGFVSAIYVGVSAIILFVRIAMIPKVEQVRLKRLRSSDLWRNSYMAVDRKTGKVK